MFKELNSAIAEIIEVVSHGGYYQEDHPDYRDDLCEKLDEESCGLFIKSDGCPNYQNMKKAVEEIDSIIKIGPGETDSFGWLTGVIYIKLKNREILKFVYG